jgi:MEDS: MEthanogen/methylotroph, DcmR Sensory domain
MRASGSVASLVDRFHDVAVSAMTGEGVELLLGLSNVAWLQKKDWKDLCEYEAQFNSSIMDQPMGVLCAYPLMTCGAAELLDVARNHQFVIATRQGSWQVIETTQLKRAGSQPWRR